jgi:hypothetical protein
MDNILTIQASNGDYEPIPAGTYQGTFQGLEDLENDFGKSYKWNFHMDDDKTLCGFSDAENSPTVKNKTGRWIAAISGLPLQEGTSINWSEYVGHRYLLVVTPGKKDPAKTRLEMFSPLAKLELKEEVVPNHDDLSIEQIQAMLKRKQEQ